MNNWHTWYTIGIIAFMTALLRFLPFLLFGGNSQTTPFVKKLGRSLPYATMGMLVVYCIRKVNFSNLEGFVPVMMGCIAVGSLHIWKRNTLLSIVAGTICYMLLVQKVF